MQRISTSLGQSSTTSTGRADSGTTTALLPILSASLSDLESSLTGEASSLVLARLLFGRLQLESFGLQLPDETCAAASNARAECLSTSVKLLQLMCSVGSDEARYWPQSFVMSILVAAVSPLACEMPTF